GGSRSWTPRTSGSLCSRSHWPSNTRKGQVSEKGKLSKGSYLEKPHSRVVVVIPEPEIVAQEDERRNHRCDRERVRYLPAGRRECFRDLGKADRATNFRQIP